MNDKFIYTAFNIISQYIGKTKANPINPVNQNCIDKFIQWYNENFDSPLNIRWLIEYILWQYAAFEDSEIANTQTINKFPMIFGSKALQRYDNKTQHRDWRITMFCRTHNIVIQDIVSTLSKSTIQNTSYRFEISIKTQYDNGDDMRFLNCIEYTTLYTKKHNCCIECCFNHQCKTLLKNNFPQLYKYRENES